MTSNAPLAKLSYSLLVASLIASAVLIIFLATPRLDWYWWLGFALFAAPVIWCLKSSRQSVPSRITVPRAEPVDFGREIYEHVSRRDAYLEDQMLRRAA